MICSFMLNLTVAMLMRSWLLTLLFIILAPFQAGDQISITAPANGDLAQGSVAITGNTDIHGFESAEISFSYETDKSGTWFLIARSDKPVSNGTLADWDTTTISDGNYRLRLIVNLTDGTTVEARVDGLRVRNYSADDKKEMATALPSPVVQAEAATALPTPTALPANPAEITRGSLIYNVLLGAAGAGLLFIAVAVYLQLRSLYRRH
jgi:hypothetical protein